METNKITNDSKLVAYCGLYCAACGKYVKGSCPGCAKNEKATWCAIRSCCMEKGYKSCADCKEFTNPMDCKKFNNIFAKFFALVFRSNRQACVAMIKEKGYENFAAYMAENKLQSIKR
jgi:hypothetical protein